MNSKVIVRPRGKAFTKTKLSSFGATRASSNLCTWERYMHTFNKLPITHARFQFSNRLGTGNWWRTWENSWRIYCSFVQCCRRFNKINKDFPRNTNRKFTFDPFSPAMAKCLMKKFIRDFRLLFISKVTRTAVLPRTMTAKSIHNTVNCSVCK